MGRGPPPGKHGSALYEFREILRPTARPRPVRLLERVECDDTKLDLMVIDPETR
jgi:hypothetical protein